MSSHANCIAAMRAVERCEDGTRDAVCLRTLGVTPTSASAVDCGAGRTLCRLSSEPTAAFCVATRDGVARTAHGSKCGGPSRIEVTEPERSS